MINSILNRGINFPLFIIISFIFSFYSNISFSQSISIVDVETYEPVSYAVVFLDSIGQYSNDKGEININNKNFNTITIDHLGYKKFRNSINNIKEIDTIFLYPKALNLDEVTVFNRDKAKIKTLKYKSYYGAILFDNSEYITCFCPKKSERFIIKEFKFLFETDNKNKLTDTTSHTFNLRIFENENYKPKQLKRRKITYNILEREFKIDEKEINFDFTDNPLIIDESGLCFSLEHITFRDKYFPVNYHRLSVQKSKKSKYFEVKTYLRYPLAFKGEMKEFSEAFKLDENIFIIPEITIYK